MAARLKRRFLLLLADTLYDWAVLLANRAGAEDRKFPDTAGTAISAMGMGDGAGFGPVGPRDNPAGGPPAHWVELVRRHAPQLLSGHEGSPAGEVRIENTPPAIRVIGAPSATMPAPAPRTSPGRLAGPPSEPEGPSAPTFKDSFSPGASPTFPGKRAGGATKAFPWGSHEEESPRREPAASFAGEAGEVKAAATAAGETDATAEPARKSPAATSGEAPRTTPEPRGKPATPAAPILRRRIFARSDSLPFSEKPQGVATENHGPTPRAEHPRAPVAPLASAAPGSPPPTRRADPERAEAEPPLADEPARTRATEPVWPSLRRPEKAPVTPSSPSPDFEPAAVKRPIVIYEEARDGNGRTELAPTGAPPLPAPRRATEPGPPSPPPERPQTTGNQEWPDRLSANRPLEASRPRPDAGDPGEKPAYPAREPEPSSPHPRAEAPRPEPFPFPGWPGLPGEPDGNDPVATAEDRWPALLEDDPDASHQPLTETWRQLSARIGFIDRARRLDREQRGLGWNE